MRLRRILIDHFRGIQHLELFPSERTVLLGPNNSGKSSVLEALDLLLHSGLGRPRRGPSELDYHLRDSASEFQIEAVVGDLSDPLLAEVRDALEGWRSEDNELVPEPDGEGVEPVLRVLVRGTTDQDLIHELAKPEMAGQRFGPRLRQHLNWVFDARTRDPGRQLAFYQGGLLERLFSDADLQPALETLQGHLQDGASALNADAEVKTVLDLLKTDLGSLGILDPDASPAFETGAISDRQLLQSLRLTLSKANDVRIPIFAEGRGIQRLVLATVLFRVARAATSKPIGAFEEPEEALEPLRQGQMARMIRGIADSGGQVFVVTHSPEIVRSFSVADIVILQRKDATHTPHPLSSDLSPATRQAYERHLDGPIVRALFCDIPVLVEGPGDRGVFNVFWEALRQEGVVPPPDQLGIEAINCEGNQNQPRMAALLHEAGKSAVPWVERDDTRPLELLTNEGHCAALLLYPEDPNQDNLERALAAASPIDALSMGLSALAEDRGYSWDRQREDLLSRAASVGVDAALRPQLAESPSLQVFLTTLPEATARRLTAAALSSKKVTPFEMKGGRQGRVVAQAIVEHSGVPPLFSTSLVALVDWINDGCPTGTQITMS